MGRDHKITIMTKILNLAARTAGAGSVALLLAVAIPNTAHAVGDPFYRACSTTGASVLLRVIQLTNDGPTAKRDLRFEITDDARDGHHARARFITVDGTGTTRYWKWHANYEGVGTIIVKTTAQEPERGIFKSGVQVARAEGSTILNSCTDWTS